MGKYKIGLQLYSVLEKGEIEACEDQHYAENLSKDRVMELCQHTYRYRGNSYECQQDRQQSLPCYESPHPEGDDGGCGKRKKPRQCRGFCV